MITKFQIAYKNLLRKKIRSFLTLVGIALSAWVLVSLLGFNHGFETALDRDIDGMGFQMLVMAKGCPVRGRDVDAERRHRSEIY